MTNRRLVPMPARKQMQSGGDVPPAPRAAMKTWHAFAFPILTALVLYFAKLPILFIAALVGFFYVLFWLCRRFPKTMFVVAALFGGIIGGGRRTRYYCDDYDNDLIVDQDIYDNCDLADVETSYTSDDQDNT
jgi:hypothetical protein